MTADRINPLLVPSDLPNMAPPFDRVQEADYLPAVEAALTEARANVAAIRDNPDAPSFANTIVALTEADETLDAVTSVFFNQLSASGGDGLHALAQQIAPMCAAFGNDVALDERLFARVKAVHDQRPAGLTPEETTLLDNSYKGFVRGGALLPESDRATLREIDARMAVLGPTYMKTVKSGMEAFSLHLTQEADLAGLPAKAIEGAEEAARERGLADGWLFTLDMPSYLPFLRFSDRRDLRETLWRAFADCANGPEFNNTETTKEIATLRHRRARLLGYDSHAAFVLEERMAKSPQTVRDFLDRLKTSYKPAAQADLARLQAFAQERDGLGALAAWDVLYYEEKLRKQLFDVSGEDFRPWFPLDTVLQGTFAHFEKLFGVKFRPTPSLPVWHPDVVAYEVVSAEGEEFIGTFYGDFYPRKGKKEGAWMTAYRDQGRFRGEVRRPVIAIVCNFDKPTASTPSLLSHDEVTTLFHEMGHAMHGMLSRVTHRGLAGTNVKWDFVELPSQVQENWAYERETLDAISGHYQTGGKIPQEMIDKLHASKTFMAGWFGLRQVSLGLLDMGWHAADPSGVTDIAAFEDELLRDVRLIPRAAGPSSTSFNHIFAGGYSSGYYSYKWAEVLDADTFELFLERGLYDPATARAYRVEILEKGGSEHPADLYRRFRGRDADPNALLRREGLIAA